MKKSLLFILSFVVLLSSVLTVVASAENTIYEDDMYDDDANVTYNAGTTATTSGSFLGGLGGLGDGVGDFVGGVVESVFNDPDVSGQVNDKVDGVVGIFDNFDLDGLIPTTQKSTVGSNFFDTIDPVVTGGFNTGSLGSGSSVQANGTPSSTNAAINGEIVDYNTTVNPYAKPTTALNPGDKGDGVKWLQWILIYTECGLQGAVTGDYDDATAAAVKTLQLKYGMTVDGIASLEVIEKADAMYNEYISGITPGSTSTPAVFNTVGGAGTSSGGGKTDSPTNVKVTVIIVVLIIVWIFAIAAVFIIVHIKRKNITLSEDGEIVKPEKGKKEKNSKKNKSKGSKRSNGSLRNYEPLRESRTLESLSDDVENDIQDDADSFETDVETDVGFEVVDIDDDYDEFDDEEITLSSLSDIKKRRAEQAQKTNE